MNYDFNSTDGLFDRMLRKQQRTVPQRQRPETHPAMPRFQGRELPLDVQLRAVAARDRRIAELNRPQPAPGLLAKAVRAVVGAAVAAVAAFSLESHASALPNSCVTCWPTAPLCRPLRSSDWPRKPESADARYVARRLLSASSMCGMLIYRGRGGSKAKRPWPGKGRLALPIQHFNRN
jgi:hypothetical protein